MAGGWTYYFSNTINTNTPRSTGIEPVLEWLNREAIAHDWEPFEWNRYIGTDESLLDPQTTSPWNTDGYSVNNQNLWQAIRDAYIYAGERLFYDYETYVPFGIRKFWSKDVELYGMYGKLAIDDASDSLNVSQTGNGVVDGTFYMSRSSSIEKRKLFHYPDSSSFSQVEIDQIFTDLLVAHNTGVFSFYENYSSQNNGFSANVLERKYQPAGFNNPSIVILTASITESYNISFKWVGTRKLRSCWGYDIPPTINFNLRRYSDSFVGGALIPKAIRLFSDFDNDSMPSIAYGFIPASLTGHWQYDPPYHGVNYNSNLNNIRQSIVEKIVNEDYTLLYHATQSEMTAATGVEGILISLDAEPMFNEEPEEEGVIFWAFGSLPRVQQISVIPPPNYDPLLSTDTAESSEFNISYISNTGLAGIGIFYGGSGFSIDTGGLHNRGSDLLPSYN